MNINKKILILGDSWSQGEIEYNVKADRHVVTHKGLEQYLVDNGAQIDNLGGLGESNAWALSQFESYNKIVDAVLWFQTDVNRDYLEDTFLTKLKETRSIKSLFRNHIIDTYDKMNSSARQKNTTVYVIGGFSAVLEDEVKEFNNIKCAIPCVINLIQPNANITFYDSFSQQLWFMCLIELVKADPYWDKDSINKLKSEWLELQEKSTKFNLLMKKDKEHFWPDGLHPNRYGHKIIYNKIKSILENE